MSAALLPGAIGARYIAENCTLEGIPLYGKVEVVESFPGES